MAVQAARPAPGEIFRHEKFYEEQPGKWLPKYFVILCEDESGDLVFRLLTSRHGVLNPRCDHGPPCPAFYLGVLGGRLTGESAVDLRGPNPELEFRKFHLGINQGFITPEGRLDKSTLCDVLNCAFGAPDVPMRQAAFIRDEMARQSC